MSTDHESWRLSAACRGLDPLRFVPASRVKNSDGVTQERESEIERALEVCVVCPVQKACGDYRRDHRIRVGVWGGKYYEPAKEASRRMRELQAIARGNKK